MFQVEQPSGEILPLREEDLDEDLRRGRINPRRRVRHPVHTEGQLRPMVEVPRLAEACATPNARLAALLWRESPAWLSHLVVALLVVLGLPQVVLGLMGHSEVLDTVWTLTATGFDPLVLDKHFWTPWTTQVSHADAGHLLGNIAVLSWSGYRVERATGALGTLLVWSAAIASGALCISLFEFQPVVGSSIAAFGLWGAQITLGFRFSDGMHPKWHRFYGVANLAVFAFLFAGTFRGGDLVSHWGHAGGLLGGVLAGLLVRGWQPGLSVAGIAGLSAMTLSIGPLYRLALSSLPTQTVDAEGLVLTLPERMVDARASMTGAKAWSSQPYNHEVVFADERRMDWRALDDGDLLWGPDLVTWLGDFGVEATLVEDPPEELGPGWNVTAVTYDKDGITYTHVEHHLVRGVWLNRVGYVVREGADVREAWYDRMLRSVSAQEPVQLVEAREEVERNPKAERLQLQYARALRNAGMFLEADAVLEPLVLHGTQRRGEAALVRMQLWGRFPVMFQPPEGEAWFQPFLEDYPADGDLARDAVRWLVHHQRCDRAVRVAETLREAWPDDPDVDRVEAEANACEG